MGKLIYRIPVSRLLIPSLPGSALRTHAESSACLAMSISVLKALPGKLDIKRHSPSILYIQGIRGIFVYNHLLVGLPDDATLIFSLLLTHCRMY